MSTLTTTAATHGTACRAYAIGSAADNIRHAARSDESAAWAADIDPITEGDGYLTSGLVDCRCDLDADDVSAGEGSLIVVGMALLDLAAARAAADPDPTRRTVADLVCAECGTHDGPFVVGEQTEVCLTCHLAVALADPEPERPVWRNNPGAWTADGRTCLAHDRYLCDACTD